MKKEPYKKQRLCCQVSQFTAHTTNKVFGLKKEFTIIPNAIDVTLFQNDTVAKFDSNTILYFGTLIRKKRLARIAFYFQ